jgi:hypothetical protein
MRFNMILATGFLAASFLVILAGVSFAQTAPTAPPPISMPQDIMQRISVYLQEGGTHNEGVALNRSLVDVIALQQKDAALKAQTDAAAKPADPKAGTSTNPNAVKE